MFTTIQSSISATTIKGSATVDGNVFNYEINTNKIEKTKAHKFRIIINKKFDDTVNIEFIIIDKKKLEF